MALSGTAGQNPHPWSSSSFWGKLLHLQNFASDNLPGPTVVGEDDAVHCHHGKREWTRSSKYLCKGGVPRGNEVEINIHLWGLSHPAKNEILNDIKTLGGQRWEVKKVVKVLGPGALKETSRVQW